MKIGPSYGGKWLSYRAAAFSNFVLTSMRMHCIVQTKGLLGRGSERVADPCAILVSIERCFGFYCIRNKSF